MTVYFILIFAICIAYFLSRHFKKDQGKKFFLIFSFFALTLISGLRGYTIGSDTGTYVDFFRRVLNSQNFLYLLLHSRFESGFIIYIKLITLFTSDTTVFLLISAALCIGPVVLIISKYSKNPFISIILYVFLRHFFFGMTGMRQTLAASFFLIAVLIYLGKNSLWRYIFAAILIAVAVSFHTSAILYFAVFALTVSKKSLITVENCVKLSIIFSVASFVLYALIMRMVAVLLPQYATYFTSTWSDANYNASLFNFLIQFVFLLVGTIFIKTSQSDTVTNFSVTALFFSIVFYALSMRMEIWERAAVGLGIFTAILWAPEFVSRIKKHNNKLFVESAVILFSCAYMIVVETFRPEWASCVPYKFFWQ